MSGELRSRPVAVLLAGACDRGTSGTFRFRSGSRVDAVTIRRGRIAVVRTSEPVGYLGGVLYELGMIELATLNESLREVAAHKRLHGEVLVARGAVTPQQLAQALAEQSFRKVEHLFELPEDSTWSFRSDDDELTGARDADRPSIETYPAIWRALRDKPVAPHVRRTLAKIEGSLQLRDLASIDRLGLGPAERAVCERLFARPSTLALLTSSSKLAVARTELLVYLLALSRSVVRVDEEPVGPAALGVHGVRERARRIDDEDPRTALGLYGAVSIEAARAAYFRLARLWHPDRIPEALAEVRSECEHVFSKLGEAHRILTDTTAHRGAAKAIEGAAPSAPRDAHANGPTSERSASGPGSGRITLRDVDAALARNDLHAADTFAHALSSAGTDGPTARAVIAWCACDGGMSTSNESLERALAALDKIVTGDPECVRALYYRALLAARLGRTEAALRDHRKVVRLDPRHVDAHRELRLHDMRHRPGAGGLRSVHLPPDRSPANTNGTGSASTPSASREGAPAGDPDGAAPDGAVSGLRRLLGRVVGK